MFSPKKWDVVSSVQQIHKCVSNKHDSYEHEINTQINKSFLTSKWIMNCYFFRFFFLVVVARRRCSIGSSHMHKCDFSPFFIEMNLNCSTEMRLNAVTHGICFVLRMKNVSGVCGHIMRKMRDDRAAGCQTMLFAYINNNNKNKKYHHLNASNASWINSNDAITNICCYTDDNKRTQPFWLLHGVWPLNRKF